MKNNYFIFFLAVLILFSCQRENKKFENGEQLSENTLPLSKEYSWENYNSSNAFGEILYIPVYSSIYHQSDRTFDLTATLSIHNADIISNITITKIDYYNTDGEIVRRFVENEIEINPLQSKQIIIRTKRTI